MKFLVVLLALALWSRSYAFLLAGPTATRRITSATTTSRRTTATTTSSTRLQVTQKQCDILVLGSGPAGCAIASLLGAKGNLKVVLADQQADRTWVPNYGVWKDEWQAVCQRLQQFGITMEGGLAGNAIDREWSVTDCYFGGSFDIPVTQRLRLDRPYQRVDRFALQKSLKTGYEIVYANHISRAVGVNLYEPAGSMVHDAQGTTVQLQQLDGSFTSVRSKLVVDCTGHETKLLLRETRDPYLPPGFQIAYGMLVDVDESTVPDLTHVGPYDKKAMTLFDYRTDHYDSEDSGTQIKVANAPTFMYAMPLKENQVFFEETSLVARPAVSFQECKDRCYRRLEHLGIKVTKVHEEEFCYIPMGGALPVRDQRIVAVGGAASVVHPSTGFNLCRCLMGAADVADAVAKELALPDPNLDRAAAAAYHTLWSPANVRQRNFAVFGGDFLMKQNVMGLRGFFDGFFRLPLPQWGGFLAGWPGLPYNEQHETWSARMWYGVSFLVRLPPSVAFDMILSIITYSIANGIPLLQSVTPFFGEPASYEYSRNNDRIGDVAAKAEARRMIRESQMEQDMPVSFEELAPAEARVTVEA